MGFIFAPSKSSSDESNFCNREIHRIIQTELLYGTEGPFKSYSSSLGGSAGGVNPTSNRAGAGSAAHVQYTLPGNTAGAYVYRQGDRRIFTPGRADATAECLIQAISIDPIVPQAAQFHFGWHLHNPLTSDTAGVCFYHDLNGIGVRLVNNSAVSIYRPNVQEQLKSVYINSPNQALRGTGLTKPEKITLKMYKDRDFAELYINDVLKITTGSLNFPELYNASRSLRPFVMYYTPDNTVAIPKIITVMKSTFDSTVYWTEESP